MILYLFIHGHQFLQSGVKWLSDAVASALNMVIQYVTEIFESAGIDGKYTENHTWKFKFIETKTHSHMYVFIHVFI